MSAIEIKSLRVENTLGWREFSINLQHRGVLYVSGPNGSGKSSILVSLLWALSGRCDRVRTLDGLVHHDGRYGGSVVEVVFSIGSHTVQVTRYRQHKTYKNACFVVVDGHEANTGSSRGSRDVLDGLIPPYEQLEQTLIFSTTMFAELAEADQKKLLRVLFDFNRFAQAGVWISDQSKVVQGKLTAAHYAQVHAEGELHAVHTSLSRERQALARAKSAAQRVSQTTAEELTRCEASVQSVQEALARLTGQRDLSVVLRREISQLQNACDGTTRSLSRLTADQRCSTCGQLLPKGQVRQQLVALKTQKAELVQTLQKKEAEYEALRPIELIDAEAAIVRVQLTAAEEYRNELRSRIQLSQADVSRIRSRIRDLKTRKVEHQKVVARKTQQATVLERRLRLYDWWNAGFSSRGIETSALKQVLPILNDRVNPILQQLPTQEKGVIQVEYVIEGTHLRPRIQYAGGSEYTKLSAGERRRVDFSTAYALQTLHPQHFNLWALDEPFTHVDLLGIRQMLTVLRSAKDTVLVMVHESGLESLFDSVLKLTNTTDACRIVSSTSNAPDVVVDT